MNNKPDLAKLFGVEDQIKPRMIYDESAEAIAGKAPYMITNEIKTLVDMITPAVLTNDLEISLKIVEAIVLRTSYIQQTLLTLAPIMNAAKNRQKKNDD